MKTILILFLAVCSVSAADIRVVGSSRINIDPVRAWAAKPTGVRPMPSWKRIQVSTVTPAAPWPICAIKIEGAETKTVYLKNLPGSIFNIFLEEDRLTKSVTEKDQWITAETKRLRLAYTHESEWEYGSPNYIQFQRDSANLENQKDTLKELRTQLTACTRNKKLLGADFALFTGQVYAKLEVWDMGQKSQ